VDKHRLRARACAAGPREGLRAHARAILIPENIQPPGYEWLDPRGTLLGRSRPPSARKRQSCWRDRGHAVLAAINWRRASCSGATACSRSSPCPRRWRSWGARLGYCCFGGGTGHSGESASRQRQRRHLPGFGRRRFVPAGPVGGPAGWQFRPMRRLGGGARWRASRNAKTATRHHRRHPDGAGTVSDQSTPRYL